ncbi:hypothetical protein V5O48_017765 [Marasmius crinis-equi]|uniref:Cytochrome P450 n=1 Tax=Marasmius crinis-equi TaxID=585013 RepID=A0ABR3EN70_9AGAR
MDDLVNLPYLDSVVRESLRLLSPILNSARVATRDDAIPLGSGSGVLRVKKGQEIIIPILAINKDKEIWGNDAEEFKPERWTRPEDLPESIPGAWSNMMTFLGGPRACIGWRFAVVEMKVLLYTLIHAFEFELGVREEDVLIKRAFPTIRPVIRNSDSGGKDYYVGMPLIVRPVPVA